MQFSKDEIPMTAKHMKKKFLTPQTSKEIQIKSSLSFLLTPVIEEIIEKIS